MEMLREAEITTDSIMLENKGHAESLCKNMSLKGIDAICIIGGDGTFHECINGLMKRTPVEEIKQIALGLIPAGTGNSFMLELQGNISTIRAIKHIRRGISVPIDLTEVYFPCYR